MIGNIGTTIGGLFAAGPKKQEEAQKCFLLKVLRIDRMLAV